MNRKAGHRKIALERVKKLLDLAKSTYKENPDLADRYCELAWKIKTRYNLRLPKDLKMKFCRKCQTFWVPEKTCRFRLHSKGSPYITITCLNCGYEKRIPYDRKDESE